MKAFATDLKTIYNAISKNEGLKVRDRVAEKWSAKYPNFVKRWIENWDVVVPIFKFSKGVRKIIYTTNAIEIPQAKPSEEYFPKRRGYAQGSLSGDLRDNKKMDSAHSRMETGLW